MKQNLKPWFVAGSLTVLAVLFQNFGYVSAPLPSNSLKSIDDIDLLPDGRLIASSESDLGAHIFTSNLQWVDSVAVNASEMSVGSPIRSLTVDNEGGLIVADLKGSFKTLDPQMHLRPDQIKESGYMISPTEVYFDRSEKEGLLYLLEKEKNMIYRLKKNDHQAYQIYGTEFEFYIDEYKTKKGQPGNLSIYRDPRSKTARYFITEVGSTNRVYIYENIFEGMPVHVGDFALPNGKVPGALAVDSKQSRVFVADPFTNQIHIYDVSGHYLSSFGGSGSSIGRFSNPRSLAVDSNTGTLYVADSGNRRIQKFVMGTKSYDPVAVGQVALNSSSQ